MQTTSGQPLNWSEIYAAYRRVVEAEGFKDVRICDLAEEAKAQPANLGPWILREAREGFAVPSRGDWSLSSERARLAAIEIDGEPHLRVRLLDREASTAMDAWEAAGHMKH